MVSIPINPFRSQRSPTSAKPYASRAAFSQLYDATHLNVYRYTLGLTGNGPDAEDVTAEAFLKAWNNRHTFHGDQEAALAWLFTIAKRLVIDRSRKRKRRPQAVHIDDLMLAAPQPGPEQATISQEQQRILWGLLDELPDQQREMLVLRYMLGWQVKQIADHLEMNANTVSVTLRRCLQRLHANWPLEGGSHA